MKRWVWIGCVVFLLTATAWAENVYVSENIRVTVRKDPGNDKKVITILTSGDQVDVVQSGAEWTKIRLPDEKEGWVLSRFLTTQRPSSAALKELQKKYDDLLAQSGGIPPEDARRLKEEKEKLAADQHACTKQLQTLNDSYQTLKKDSQDVVQLRADYDSAKATIAEQKNKLDQLEAEVGNANFDQYIKWFLAGGGVLLIGFIIGSISRKKRSYSLIR